VFQNASTVGYKLGRDITSCEVTVARLTAGPGMRLVRNPCRDLGFHLCGEDSLSRTRRRLLASIAHSLAW